MSQQGRLLEYEAQPTCRNKTTTIIPPMISTQPAMQSHWSTLTTTVTRRVLGGLTYSAQCDGYCGLRLLIQRFLNKSLHLPSCHISMIHSMHALEKSLQPSANEDSCLTEPRNSRPIALHVCSALLIGRSTFGAHCRKGSTIVVTPLESFMAVGHIGLRMLFRLPH